MQIVRCSPLLQDQNMHQHISNCFHQYKRNSVRLHNLSRIAICGKVEEIPMKFLLIIGPLTVLTVHSCAQFHKDWNVSYFKSLFLLAAGKKF